MYLVDTSVWIDFLRGRDNEKVVLLESLLERGEACLCEVTFAEICFGTKGTGQFKKYKKQFSQIPFLSLSDDWHLEIAEMGFKLRSKGYKPFVADMMIALAAITHDVPLLTRDKDFLVYQKLFDIKTL